MWYFFSFLAIALSVHIRYAISDYDRIMITTNGTYQWSFLTPILGNGCDRDTFEAMT
jgi:hypothetical protein